MPMAFRMYRMMKVCAWRLAARSPAHVLTRLLKHSAALKSAPPTGLLRLIVLGMRMDFHAAIMNGTERIIFGISATNTGRDWRDLAYWLHDHIEFTAIVFFGNQCSFNLNWRPGYAEKKIKSWITEKGGCPLLTKANCEPNEPLEARQGRYADFPTFGGLLIPQLPAEEAAE